LSDVEAGSLLLLGQQLEVLVHDGDGEKDTSARTDNTDQVSHDADHCGGETAD
jgi:hypothetical protein